MQKLDIIIPVFNEAGNIKELVDRIDKAMRDADMAYQLIFVDDNSTDETGKEIKVAAKSYPVTLLIKKGERGKAFSILEGAKFAKSDYIAMIDGDLQYPPEAIPEMYKLAIERGVCVANRKKANTSFIRKIGSKVNTLIFGKLLLGLDCDPQSGLKVFKREIIDELDTSEVTKWTLDMPLLHKAMDLGYEIASVDIIFSARKSGDSKVDFLKASSEIAKQAIKLRFKKTTTISIAPSGKNSMIGAGVIHKRKRYITHTTLPHGQSAMFTVTKWQKFFFISLLLLFVLGIILNALITFTAIIALLSAIYFADMCFNLYVLSKSLGTSSELKVSQKELDAIDEKELPTYSVLCPLYKEAHVLPHFIASIEKIDWPKNKLDVMLLLEENDRETIDAAKNLNLPKYIRIVVVPHSFPKTKPKACNYGLSMAKGEYVVIYDAEDEPDPLQLKKAYLGFRRVGPKVFCLQSKLNYYNPSQNFLTRLFTAEYSLWFDLTLPGLQSMETTIPLGGTSNHFRTADLMKLQGWDPFNVTEDCDLGVRLFRQGYKTAIIDSTTYEEANSSVRNWIRQRSRWIKGYLQTYLVHNREPLKLFQENGLHALIMQLIIGMRVIFILINPFLWAATFSYFAFHRYVGATITALYPTPIFYLAVLSLILGNYVAFYSYMVGLAKRGQWGVLKFIFLIPFYWVITSIASYIAFYQLIFKPHYWEKTKHGLHLETAKEIKTYNTTGVISGGILVVASVGANFFNFAYNTYLGRVLNASDFGTVGLIGGIFFVSQILTNAIGRTLTYKSGFLSGKYKTPIKTYWSKIRSKAILFAILFTIIWVLMAPALKILFHTGSLGPFLLFAPIWVIGLIAAIDSGFLSGNLFFIVLGISSLLTALLKFVFAYTLVRLGFDDWVYLAIPLSLTIPFLINWIVILRLKTKEGEIKVERSNLGFPIKFFGTAILTNISSIAFLSLDVILAKAFLPANDAGLYTILSLTGQMIYFFGSLFSQFVTPLVSRAEGLGKDSRKTFYIFLTATLAASLFAFLFIGILGHITVPILFGSKAYGIIEFLPEYGLAMIFFSLALNIVSYHQLKKQYIFPFFSVFLSAIEFIALYFFHANLPIFVTVMFVMSVINFAFFFILHFIYKNIKSVLDEVKKTSLSNSKIKSGLRILIFNWRDTKHVWAGGAENYLHEIAKRWVKEGNSVTVFCGNDGNSSRNEVVDGVQIVRRGGFYTVYIWAFLYYILRFRGNFDVVVDSQNGIPFFTPLYVAVPKVLVIYHVHQDVFRKHLMFPFNRFAMFVEKDLAPLIYSGQKVVTISKSSRIDIAKIVRNQREDEIEIVNPGVDFGTFKTCRKTLYPSFIYLGRLMHYKNVDVAIRAFAKVVAKKPEAKFFVAGYGEARGELENLTKELKISKNVEFLGKVSDKDRVCLLGKAWLAIQPSSAEGWGMTIIEANACGTPVIASNINGLKDSVVDGKTGFLMPVKDVGACAKIMLELIQDKSYLNTLSREAFNWAKKFDWNYSSVRFAEVLMEVI